MESVILRRVSEKRGFDILQRFSVSVVKYSFDIARERNIAAKLWQTKNVSFVNAGWMQILMHDVASSTVTWLPAHALANCNVPKIRQLKLNFSVLDVGAQFGIFSC